MQSNGGVAQVVLTGGRVAAVVYRAVAESPARSAIDWRRVEFWWGDERFLPEGDPERNDTQARDALLSHVDVDPALVHAMPADTGQGAEAAAEAYASASWQLASSALRATAMADGVPAFDVLMLGVGPDGHVASLFPGYPGRVVVDKLGGRRARLPQAAADPGLADVPGAGNARETWFVVSGEDKADAVADALSGDSDLPARSRTGIDRTLWLLDEAASSKL